MILAAKKESSPVVAKMIEQTCELRAQGGVDDGMCIG
jgi:hypothetical protein